MVMWNIMLPFLKNFTWVEKKCILIIYKFIIIIILQNYSYRNITCQILEPEINYQESIAQIINANCSFAELEYHWAATKNFRAFDVAAIPSNCGDIINKWPQYKKPLGYKLVSNMLQLLMSFNWNNFFN